MSATAAIAAGGCLAAIAMNTAGAVIPNVYGELLRARFRSVQADMDRIAAGKRPIMGARHATAEEVEAYLALERRSVRA